MGKYNYSRNVMAENLKKAKERFLALTTFWSSDVSVKSIKEKKLNLKKYTFDFELTPKQQRPKDKKVEFMEAN